MDLRVTSLYRIHLCIQDGSTPSNRSSVCLAFNHCREAIASLRYVTPHPTMTEMLAVEDLVINSALYSQSHNRMTDDYQTFFIAGVGFYFHPTSNRSAICLTPFSETSVFCAISSSETSVFTSIAAIAVSLFIGLQSLMLPR